MQKIWKSAGGLSDSLGELLEVLSTWRETLKNVIMLLLVITLFFFFSSSGTTWVPIIIVGLAFCFKCCPLKSIATGAA